MSKNYFDRNVNDTVTDLETSLEMGLSSVEYNKRLASYGKNSLEGKKPKTFFQMYLAQLKDFLVIILVVAACVSIAFHEVLDGVIILAIVILNAFLGATQENKASNALKALKEMSSPQAKALRDGSVVKVPSDSLVPGDVVYLEAGDYVPADLRLSESINLKIDEAALTGESLPVEKRSDIALASDAPLGDRVNCAYMGTVVTYGRGSGVVTGTGMSTQMGQIAKMLNETTEEATPLQKKLDSFGKLLGVVCIIVCVAIFGLGVLRKMPLLEVFMTAVSLAVAAIPEGLTVVVTVVLALGMQAMVKVNTIVKKLSAVETLGSTTVICSDKTGTLTQNKMTVTKVYDGISTYKVTGTGYNKNGSIENFSLQDDQSKLLMYGVVLCNDSQFDNDKEQIIGDPTEGALLVLGEKVGIGKGKLNTSMPRVHEIPFDSDRKLMSSFHNTSENDDSKLIMFTKGAPDEVLRRVTHIFKNGVVSPVSEGEKDVIADTNQRLANEALRVLGIAYRQVDKINTEDELSMENNLVFLGLVGMIDPPREEAKQAVALCKQAGIKVKMITGDHKITASAIGEALGIISDKTKEKALSGSELSELTDNDLKSHVKSTNIFARVSPEHKVRLVTALKENGEIVAMTGDGVNDAPSLKKADIGVAMGITGTDVSKEAADMILTDDNFASIVRAVEEGRTIYNNIRKVVAYLLSCNIGEILLIFSAMLFMMPVPLVPIQLLSINLVTDAFPAFALGMEAKEEGVMAIPPRDPKASIVDKEMKMAVAFQSIALALGALGSFIYAIRLYDTKTASTFCFITLIVGELLRVYSSRSETISIFKMKIFSNSFLNKAVFFSLIFLFATVYVPFLNPIFNTVALSVSQFLIAICFSLLPLLGGELAKIFSGRKSSSPRTA